MFLSRILRSLKLSSVKRCNGMCGVASTEEFQKTLQCNRARADRNGQSFSVLVFNTPNNGDHSGALDAFSKLIVRRVRLSDLCGWFDETHLGVLLLDSSPEGILKVAEDICGNVSANAWRPAYRIYTYPDDHYSSGASGRDDLQDDEPSETQADRLILRPCESIDQRVSSFGNGHAQSVEWLEHLPMLPVPGWKRMLDVVGASAGLMLSLPILVLIASAIKIISPGPVFYKQERIGHLGKRFTFWKFRTMVVNADPCEHKNHVCGLISNENVMKKLDNCNPQIIPFIGKFLRSSCLDELPQLFNVLLGDMSLVGPRPCLPYECERYLHWHKRRFDAMPGMTGLWQVSGKNKMTFREMVRLDIAYEQQMSLGTDLKILLMTFPAILDIVIESFSAKKGQINEQA
jgi:lipopolysaccharide/colanic/teichoic acid biosynthesis glycosyltransferase